MPPGFVEQLPALLDEIDGPMVAIRHDLHAHPELSFHERRTTRIIRDRLEALGWDLRPCPTETGAVARLRGVRPGRRVALRADIDALPIQEESALDYRSVHDGVMHACGHDVHTAGLLGVADLLARRRHELAGEYLLFFQPAEEGLGGARAMIDAGLLDAEAPDVVLGAHVTSLVPVGYAATRPGVLMSEAHAFDVTIQGAGGHGAMAAAKGNVILAATWLAPRLGGVVEGLAFEGVDCACSAGVVRAGTAANVVPRTATVAGTLRTFTTDQRATALARLKDLLGELEASYEVACTLAIPVATPAVTNDPIVTDRVLEVTRRLLGEDRVLATAPVTPSDDVSEFLNRIPGCYLFVGGAHADGSSGTHHSPDFAVSDASCRVWAGVLAASAVELAQL